MLVIFGAQIGQINAPSLAVRPTTLVVDGTSMTKSLLLNLFESQTMTDSGRSYFSI